MRAICDWRRRSHGRFHRNEGTAHQARGFEGPPQKSGRRRGELLGRRGLDAAFGHSTRAAWRSRHRRHRDQRALPAARDRRGNRLLPGPRHRASAHRPRPRRSRGLQPQPQKPLLPVQARPVRAPQGDGRCQGRADGPHRGGRPHCLRGGLQRLRPLRLPPGIGGRERSRRAKPAA